jgi:hypothetical protein
VPEPTIRRDAATLHGQVRYFHPAGLTTEHSKLLRALLTHLASEE